MPVFRMVRLPFLQIHRRSYAARTAEGDIFDVSIWI
jgi:hypothetical protein